MKDRSVLPGETGAAPGRRRIGEDQLLPRSRSARSCHARVPARGRPAGPGVADRHQEGHGGGRGVRPRPPGRADPACPLRAGRRGVGRDRDHAAAAAGPALACRRLLRLGAGPVPQAGPQQGMGQAGGRLGWPSLPSPSGKALRDVRRRLGAAPFESLFEALAGPVAQPGTPGVRFGRYRTVAFTGACRPRPRTPKRTGPGWAR